MKTELKQIRQTIALLKSMIEGGEIHSLTSDAFIAEAMKNLDKLESEPAKNDTPYWVIERCRNGIIEWFNISDGTWNTNIHDSTKFNNKENAESIRLTREQTEGMNYYVAEHIDISEQKQPEPMPSAEEVLEEHGFDIAEFAFENEYSAKNLLIAMKDYAKLVNSRGIDLKALYAELEKDAYNVDTCMYEVKQTNQIIRKYFEKQTGVK